MAYLRIRSRGRVNKPLPVALISALPAVKDNLSDLRGYAQRVNVGKPNEEATDTVTWGNETDYIWWLIDMAIPMPLPQIVQDKLVVAKAKLQQLKQYAVNTGEVAFYSQYHICHHGDNPSNCEGKQEI